MGKGPIGRIAPLLPFLFIAQLYAARTANQELEVLLLVPWLALVGTIVLQLLRPNRSRT